MAIVLTLLDDPNSRMPPPAGDAVPITLLASLSGNYPALGEDLDVSPFVKNAIAIMWGGWVKNPAGGLALLPIPQNAANGGGTAWKLRMHASGANAGDAFPEFAAGAYPGGDTYELRLVVFGRPVTDGS